MKRATSDSMYGRAEGRRLPIYINMHGGGVIITAQDQDDLWCRYVKRHAECVVVNIDHVVAPVFTFPAPALQCHEIVHWITLHADDLGVDTDRMTIAGCSAGGNLAIAVALLSIEKQAFRFRALLPIVPIGDFGSDFNKKNIILGRKQQLPVKSLGLVRDVYIPKLSDRSHPLASPIFSKNLRRLPPTLIFSGGYDSLDSDGLAFETKLRASGEEVEHLSAPEGDHGFIVMGPRELGMAIWDSLVEDHA